LRSGAFAPDFPFVIFVVAFGDCLQIPSGASTALASPVTTTPCYEGLWFGALQDLWSGKEICGAAGLLPPGRRQPGIGLVGRRGGVRFALAGIGLLMVRRHGGWGGDGRRRDDSPQPADLFAPPIGHWSSSGDWGRAA